MLGTMKTQRPIAVPTLTGIVLFSILRMSSSFVLPLPVQLPSGVAQRSGNKFTSSSQLSPTAWSQHRALDAHDVLVTIPGGGEQRTVSAEEGQTILDALEAVGIDAPYSCRSGLCTE